MTRVNSTWANGARAMAVPGWPELAARGASMASPRMTLMPSCSRAPAPVWVPGDGGLALIAATLSAASGRGDNGPPGHAAPTVGQRDRNRAIVALS